MSFTPSTSDHADVGVDTSGRPLPGLFHRVFGLGGEVRAVGPNPTRWVQCRGETTAGRLYRDVGTGFTLGRHKWSAPTRGYVIIHAARRTSAAKTQIIIQECDVGESLPAVVSPLHHTLGFPTVIRTQARRAASLAYLTVSQIESFRVSGLQSPQARHNWCGNFAPPPPAASPAAAGCGG